MTASATSRIVKKGKHRTVTTWKPCDCGAVHDPPVEYGTREVDARGSGPSVYKIERLSKER